MYIVQIKMHYVTTHLQNNQQHPLDYKDFDIFSYIALNLTCISLTYWNAICLFNVKHQILNEGHFIKGKNNLYSWGKKQNINLCSSTIVIGDNTKGSPSKLL